jgi:dephospho-CoA kinase
MDKQIIGITGNAACGKTTVAKAMAEHEDWLCLSTDEIAKKIIFDPEYCANMTVILGTACLNDAGDALDKDRVRSMLFREENRDLKKSFENQIHPMVWRIVEDHAQNCKEHFVLVESAILYEYGSQNRYDSIVLVHAEPKTQILRMVKGRGIEPFVIGRIMQSQINQDWKMLQADYLIDGGGKMEDTENELREVQEKIMVGIAVH